jgi:hypothetical protein
MSKAEYDHYDLSLGSKIRRAMDRHNRLSRAGGPKHDCMPMGGQINDISLATNWFREWHVK